MSTVAGGWLRGSWSTGLSRLLPIVALAAALTAFATLYMRYDQASYKPLFGAREQVRFEDVVSVLDADHIAYRMHPDTGQVLVASGDLARARMTLAMRGVTAKQPPGLEQMDRNDPLGTSQFVQDVRFRRGLESELAQSLMTLEPVERARVHLSITKSSSFVLTGGEKSTASVVLTVKSGRRLTKEQVAAVVNLVASGTPNLEPARVSVVDQHGAFLSAHINLDGDLGGADDVEAHVREEVAKDVQDLLAPALGSENFRVSVVPVVSSDKIEETREQYAGEPKITNEATRDEQNRGEPAGRGVPGSLSNRPVDAKAPPSGGADNGSHRNAVTRQFAYDRDVTQIRRGPGQLERLSVAVVLNNAVSPEKGKPWTADQIKHIEEVLRAGLGINDARGDKLVVSSLDFAVVPLVPASVWWKDADTLAQAGWYLAYAVFALLGYWLIARPLLQTLQKWAQHTYSSPGSREVMPVASPESQVALALPGDEVRPGPGVTALFDDVELPPADSGLDVLVDHARTLSEKEPDRVAEVIKQWIRNDPKATA
ncbi:flagellar basal-body MS-ring/collar protein FliF [Pandoraea apista]|uniref:flagellar basal-body MS-ring/collar protein FliF n=1 Tax=Pandoraea apista TaxID=93218 RepID=UPI000F66B06D|nr:flagellar basal-body MS-ring/collar protein FliF [Pandoraea apista]RRW88801.1 flagellar M-ring protein FliF [Pandoraea apista]RRW98060.1 flagellar M-ring protein FliF [Pandoraea apista]